MNQEKDLRKAIRRFVVLLLLLVVVSIAWWVMQHGSIRVTISNHPGQSVTYRLVEQVSGNVISIESDMNPQTVRLKKGSYDVFTQYNDTGSVAISSVGGWLGTTELQVELGAEFGRQFIANDTSSCVESINEAIVSFECEGPVTNIKYHVPATDRVPPYSYKFPTPGLSGTIESVLDGPDGPLVLISTPISPFDDGSLPSAHRLHKLVGTISKIMEAAPFATLNKLDPTKKYSAQNYESGFIVYDSAFSELYKYESFDPSVEPSKIGHFSPERDGVAMSDLSISGSNIVVLFSNILDQDSKGASEVLIGNTEKAVSLSFKKAYGQSVMCGSNKLCLLGPEGMDIYEISGGDAKLVYAFPSASRLFMVGEKSIVLTNDKLYDFDVKSRQGKQLFEMGDLTLRSLQADKNGYMVNVEQEGAKYLLRLNPDVQNDNIDKKIALLEKNDAIKQVTVYKDSVFISPNVGKLEYNSATGVYEYSKQRRSDFASKLPELLKSAGIDTAKYKIINTLP